MAGVRGAPARRLDGLHCWIAHEADPARVEPLLRAALRALLEGHAHDLKHGRRKALYPLRLQQAPRSGARSEPKASEGWAPDTGRPRSGARSEPKASEGRAPDTGRPRSGARSEPKASEGGASEAGGPQSERGSEALRNADHLLKVNRYPRLEGLRRRLTGSKARRELALAETAAARGVPTPVPLAAAEERRGGGVRACYLLVAVVPGYADLRAVSAEPSLAPAERRALATAFGAFTRRVHDAGLFQDDFAPNNFLVSRGLVPKLLMIDFERARLRRRNPARGRRFMLGKVDRELAGARASDRMRFLLAYAGGDRGEARHWWRTLERYAARLARRDLDHLLRAARREGRRFRRLEHAGWRGVARVDAESEPLRAVLEAGTLREADAVAARAGARCVELRGGLPEARESVALATLLSKRGGLAPAPRAAAARRGTVRVVLERAPGERPLPEVEDRAAARGAVRLLALRLLRLGRLRGPIRPDRIGVLPGPGGALAARWWPGPELALSGYGDPQARRRAEALAEELVA